MKLKAKHLEKLEYGKFRTTSVFNKYNHLRTAEKVSSYGRSHVPFSSVTEVTLD